MAGRGRVTVRARVAVAVLLGLLLIAGGFAYYATLTATGTLAIRIRDTPVTWSHVIVTFAGVDVQPAGAANESGWTSLTLQTTQIDFLALANMTKLLALDHLAPGGYAGLRVLIAAVSGVLSSGVPVAMTVSDAALQAATPFTVRGGSTTTLTLDINLAQSIRQAGGAWLFVPVLGSVEVG